MISAQTEAATGQINLKNHNMPVTFYVIGTLGAGESISFEYYDGRTWQTANVDGSDIKLTTTGQVLTWWAPMNLRLSKTVTAAAAGVGVS